MEPCSWGKYDREERLPSSLLLSLPFLHHPYPPPLAPTSLLPYSRFLGKEKNMIIAFCASVMFTPPCQTLSPWNHKAKTLSSLSDFWSREQSRENRYHAHLPFTVLSEEARLIHLPNTVVDKSPFSQGAPGHLGKQTHGAMRTGAQAPTHTAGEREGRNLLKVFIALSFPPHRQRLMSTVRISKNRQFSG